MLYNWKQCFSELSPAPSIWTFSRAVSSEYLVIWLRLTFIL